MPKKGEEDLGNLGGWRIYFNFGRKELHPIARKGGEEREDPLAGS